MRHPHSAGPLVVTVGFLAAYNVTRTLVIPPAWQLLASLGAAGVILLIASWARLSTTDIGLHEDHHARGALWGGTALLVILAAVAGYAVVAELRGTSNGTLDDPRLRVSFSDLLYQVAVDTPLGTVVLEELAFRGVLLALLLRRLRPVWAVTVSSLLFGCWHILPSITTAVSNGASEQIAATPAGLVLVVAGTVLATSVAGVVFCWLRLRSGSLLAPALAHLGTNDISYVVGWLFNRIG